MSLGGFSFGSLVILYGLIYFGSFDFAIEIRDEPPKREDKSDTLVGLKIFTIEDNA